MIWTAGMFWYLQDLLQILGGSPFLVPEVFFLAVFSLAAARGDVSIFAVWLGFLGGLVWDLRWTGLPGFSASLLALVMGMATIVWQSIPSQGRHGVLFFLLALGSHAVLGGVRGVLFALSGADVWQEVFWQQILGLPLAGIAALWVVRREGSVRVP